MAHLLRSIGWDAVVFERNAEELASRGVGLGTHPQLIAILRRAGIAFDETMGIQLPKAVCLDRDGTTLVEQPTTRIMSGWSRLYRALRDALPAADYRLGRQAASRRTERRGRHGDLRRRQPRTRRFAGRRRRHPLHGPRAICAAGRAGLCRLCCPGGPCSTKAEVPRNIWREMFDLYAFCKLPEGEQLIVAIRCRVTTTTLKSAGAASQNIVWYPANGSRKQLADMCTDADRQASWRRYPAAADSSGCRSHGSKPKRMH